MTSLLVSKVVRCCEGTCAFFISAFCFPAPFLVPIVQASAFDGITIIDLQDDESDSAIRGRSDGPIDTGRYLITYVSGLGTYAALLGERGGSASCVAWARLDSLAEDSISFGVPASTASQRVHPKICQPFTIEIAGNDTVRIIAQTQVSNFGPLHPSAQFVDHSAQRPVLARVPLVSIDWGAPHMQRHKIRGLSLGPIPAVENALGNRGTLKVRDSGGALQGNAAEIDFAMDAQGNYSRINGRVIERSVLQWPWQVLYQMHDRVQFPQASTSATYEAAIVNSHGQASAKKVFPKGPLHTPESNNLASTHYWLYDLAGNQLGVDDAKTDNCLATLDHWITSRGLSGRDIGPWGCSLIVVFDADAGPLTVQGYRVEFMSGYAAALMHFARRVSEVNALKREVESIDEYKPTF